LFENITIVSISIQATKCDLCLDAEGQHQGYLTSNLLLKASVALHQKVYSASP